MSPTRLSLQWLRKSGYLAEVTEKFVHVPHAEDEDDRSFRKDLYGFIDIIAIRQAVTLAVQTTSNANVAARVHKIERLAEFDWVKRAGWLVQVHGWSNSGGKWGVRVVDMSTMPTQWSDIMKSGRRSKKRPCVQRALSI